MALRDEVLSLSPRAALLPPAQRATLERTLRSEFGPEGVRAYRLLTGANALRDVREEVELTDSELIAILRFLVKREALDMRELAFSTDAAEPRRAGRTDPEAELVRAQFGDEGVKAYRLLSEGRAQSELPELVGLSEDELIELIEFLHAEGILHVKGEADGDAAEPGRAPEAPEEPAGEPVEFAAPRRAIPRAPPADLPPIYVPSRKRLGLFAKLKTEAELLKKFGTRGIDAYNLVDGKRSTVRIAKDARLSFSALDGILNHLYGEGAVDMRIANEDDIHERYGDEGVAINEVYGRDGLLIYDLINKKYTVPQIVEASGVEPERGVEILTFIHRLLGVDIPFDAQAVLERIGKK